MGATQAGTLYVVATPIGNLGDLTARAREVLAAVDAICAEDTRHTRQLLGMLGVDRPLLALHEHNEAAMAARLVARLQAGEALALVPARQAGRAPGKAAGTGGGNAHPGLLRKRTPHRGMP